MEFHRAAGRIAMGAGVAAAAAVLAVACESPPPAPQQAEPGTPAAEVPLDRFSVARARADAEALAVPPESGGAPAVAVAERLALVKATLRELDVDFEEVPLSPGSPGGGDPWTQRSASAGPGPALVATLPGRSPTLFVLLAGVPTAAAGRQVDAAPDTSAAAVLLELTRVLSTRSLPYTTRLVWLPEASRPAAAGEGAAAAEGAAEPAGGTAEEAEAGAGATAAARLASWLEDEGALPRLRLLVTLDSACAADLRIARDLGSHRMHRETFFRAAQRLGHTRVFPPAAAFETVEGPHVPFRERGVRTVVALAPSHLARAEGDVPGAEPGGACAPESLESVGVVLLEGIDVIGQRLAKIDRFSRSPLLADAEEGEPAGAEEGEGEPAPGTGGDASAPALSGGKALPSESGAGDGSGGAVSHANGGAPTP